jgi:Phosphatidylinositol N-acetylglucosaminyltransferase
MNFVVGCVILELLEYSRGDASESGSSDRRTLLCVLVQLNGYTDTDSAGARTVKASLLVFLALIALAPILRTLTAPTSADSIWALATALFLVHAVLADYSYAMPPVQSERSVPSFVPFSCLRNVDKSALSE